MNSLGTVLCETIAVVSLSAPPTITHDAEQTSVTSRQQGYHITMPCISRLGCSCWRLVAGYVCEVLQYCICHRYYVGLPYCLS